MGVFKNKGKKRKHGQQTIADAFKPKSPPNKKRKIAVDDEDDDGDIDVKSNGKDEKEEDDEDEDNDNEDVEMAQNTTTTTDSLRVNTNVSPNKGASPPPIMAPGSPKMASDHRTPCTYDEGCYRKRSSHYAEYAHPKKERAERERVRGECAQSVDKINERKARMAKAADVCKDKKMAAAQKEYEEAVKVHQDKLDAAAAEAQKQHDGIMEKARKEFEEKLMEIKQTEQFELEKIEKKFHPERDD